MNREITFRGKEKDTGKWKYGDLIVDFSLKNNYYIGDNDCNEVGDVYYQSYDVIPETIGQFTGLKDKNGKKIFEGDIVEEGCNGLISSVVWDNEIGTYKLKDLGDYYIKDAPIEWEVIGNIYEDNLESEVSK